jgi:predicted transcriptional regulator
MANPEPVSVIDLESDAELEGRLDAEAEADVAAGRVISHERMTEWLNRLTKGERTPPPVT